MSRSGRRRGHPGGADPRPEDEAGVIEGAGGVVFNDAGGVLVLQHANGTWVFPKGHIEAGEGPLETAVREVEEEAGVTARCEDDAVTWTTQYRNPRGERRRITWYRLRTDAHEPVLREALFPDGAFLEPSEALDRLSFREDQELLRRMLNGEAEGDA